MDYILLATLGGFLCVYLMVVYDIACQWSKHSEERLTDISHPLHLQIADVDIEYAIPKGHIGAHGPACQTNFSLNYLPGSARTDGEGVERDWAHMNGLVPSTREMGHGNRQETMNDHWGAWNWQKFVKLGEWVFFRHFMSINLILMDSSRKSQS